MTDLAAGFQESQAGYLPGHLGMEWSSAEVGRVEGRLAVQAHHLAPHGRLHAATVVALADTACGFGCRAMIPAEAYFTTVELKTNFLGTLRQGTIACIAKVVHAGRTTQVWDAEVRNEEDNKLIALFRCTQMILYPGERK